MNATVGTVAESDTLTDENGESADKTENVPSTVPISTVPMAITRGQSAERRQREVMRTQQLLKQANNNMDEPDPHRLPLNIRRVFYNTPASNDGIPPEDFHVMSGMQCIKIHGTGRCRFRFRTTGVVGVGRPV